MTPTFSLRRGLATDQHAIKRLARKARINRFGLHWNCFTLAVDSRGDIIACGQTKRHRDGSFELASLAVEKSWRGRGVARTIIESLTSSFDGQLWLICRSTLTPLYERFGFKNVEKDQNESRYFRRIQRVAAIARRLVKGGENITVMRRRRS